MLNKLLFIIALSLLFQHVHGQVYRCMQYNNRQGLQNNLTKAVAQDSLGFIWVATDNGLARFDGLNFQQYSVGLPSTYIKGLLKTKKGKLYASTDLGITEITSRLDSVSFKTIIQGTSVVTDSTVHFPKLLYEDSKENIWITDDMGMCRLKNGKFKRYVLDPKLATYTYYRTLLMVEAKDGTIFVFSQNGYSFFYDAQTDKFVEMTDIPKFSAVSYAYMEKNGAILVCASDGIYELSLTANRKKKDLKKVIPGLNVNFIVRTPQGEWYASTWINGIYRLNGDKEKWTASKIANFPFERSNYLMTDSKSNLFVCTDAGIVLVQKNFFQIATPIANQSYINSLGLSTKDETWFPDGGRIFKMKAGEPVSSLAVPFPIKGEITIVEPSKLSPDHFWVATSTSQLILVCKDKVIKSFDFQPIGRTIFFAMEDKEGNLWACLDGIKGILKVSKDFSIKQYDEKDGLSSRLLVIRQNDRGEIFGGGVGDQTYLFEYLPEKDRFENRSLKLSFEHTSDLGINDLCFESEKVWLASSQGVFSCSKGHATRLEAGFYTDNMVRSIAIDKRGSLWYAIDKGIIKYVFGSAIMFNEDNGLSTITAAYRCIHIDAENHIWIGTSLGLNYAKNEEQTIRTSPPIISSILINKDIVSTNSAIIKMEKGSYLNLKYICFGFPANEIIYQYRLEGEDREWTDLYSKTELILPNIPVGKHRLQIRSKQQGNFLWSDPCQLNFVVVNPWYQRWWSYLLFSAIFGLLLRLFVYFRMRQYRRANVRLEKIVDERTQELQLKNSDLLQKNEEILAQRDEIEGQKNELETKRKHITSSIQYAQRIQNAVLSSNDAIAKVFPEHFILYQPRDIVSGDFYFMKEIDNKIVLAAADCTGHGVPGGFMSILGTTLLNEIVLNRKNVDPAETLNQLRHQVKTALQQTGKRGQQQDGMDMALCCIDLTNLSLQFAGANLPLYLFQNDEGGTEYSLNVIKGDKMPIGIHPHDSNSFTCKHVKLKRGDRIYLFSDGMISQFGGEKGLKFKSKNFQEMLISIHHLPMKAQKEAIEKRYESWKGNSDQVDDILIFGFQI